MKRAQTKSNIAEIRPPTARDIDAQRVTDDSQYRGEVAHRFLTDHFFAAEILLREEYRFIPRLHQPAVDLYFGKNPNIPIEDQHPVKYRLHIDPRKTFKTSLGRVDSTQWICAFPERITTLQESATQPLAAAISEGLGRFFYQRPKRPPTLVQRIFPELVTEKAPEAKWNTPNHSDIEIDATCDYTSPKTSQSGWHPFLICVDDMVDTTNSGIGVSHDVRKHVIDVYYQNENLLRKGGYINIRGTRYHPFDLYGDLLNKMNPHEWKVLVRGCMRVKSGKRIMPGEFPAEDEVELLFPELLPYEELRDKFTKSYEAAMCQLMNDPQGGAVPTFTEKSYLAALSAPEKIPPMGETVICWRLPYGGKPYMAKFAEGAAARFYGNRIYILDAWQGIYTPSGLAEKIVREQKRWGAAVLMMEAIPGTEYLDIHIRNEGIKRNVSFRTQWLDFIEDDATRSAQIKNLEPVLESGRISISTAASHSSEIRRQFIHFGLVLENGIIDSISRLTSRLPLSVFRQEIKDEELALQRRRQEDAMFNMVFNQGGVRHAAELREKEAAAMSYAMNRTNEFGLPDMYGLDG